jgi:hypothetical protein
MKQEPHVGAYWEARQETHQDCVTRTLEFMRAISQEPGLNKWCIPGRTRKESDTPQELSMEAIGKRTKPIWKRCKGISAPDLTDRLGFSFSVWNGDDKASAGISVHCGSYAPDQLNDVSLELPEQPFPGDEASRGRFKRLLDIFVKIWDPDLAVVTTRERKDVAFADADHRTTRAGWKARMTKSGWLVYKRGQPLVVDTTV